MRSLWRCRQRVCDTSRCERPLPVLCAVTQGLPVPPCPAQVYGISPFAAFANGLYPVREPALPLSHVSALCSVSCVQAVAQAQADALSSHALLDAERAGAAQALAALQQQHQEELAVLRQLHQEALAAQDSKQEAALALIPKQLQEALSQQQAVGSLVVGLPQFIMTGQAR